MNPAGVNPAGMDTTGMNAPITGMPTAGRVTAAVPGTPASDNVMLRPLADRMRPSGLTMSSARTRFSLRSHRCV